jgi:hypothetical protein
MKPTNSVGDPDDSNVRVDIAVARAKTLWWFGTDAITTLTGQLM